MILRPRKKRMDTVEELMAMASRLAEKAGAVKVASCISKAIGSKTPTELLWELTSQDPLFKHSYAGLALQQAERELNIVNLARQNP